MCERARARNAEVSDVCVEFVCVRGRGRGRGVRGRMIRKEVIARPGCQRIVNGEYTTRRCMTLLDITSVASRSMRIHSLVNKARTLSLYGLGIPAFRTVFVIIIARLARNQCHALLLLVDMNWKFNFRYR